MPKPPAADEASESKLLDIEFYLDAALTHGDESDGDHEIGDLQQYLRAAWSLLTPAQQLAFAKNSDVRWTLEAALPSFDMERELAKLP